MTPTKEEYQAVLFNYNQLEKQWYEQRKLISELVDALASKEDDFTIPESEHYGLLLQLAREALKS